MTVGLNSDLSLISRLIFLAGAAFLDPKSGMVNLVVEYMDGGSLQDIVDNGGYREELVLADIASQVHLPSPPLPLPSSRSLTVTLLSPT
jgi:serine/threonine protein kinase